MKELSIFEHFNKVASNQSLDTIVEQIRTGKYKEPVEQLRSLLQQNNEKEYTARKKSLPAFTPSGRFSGGRKPEFLQEYSRIIILDIDKLEEINNVRYKAMFNHFTLCCFISPSGSGLKILVRTDNSISKHREAFLKVQSYYEKFLNVKIDPSGKDVTRLCFLSWDPEIHYNKDSETFKIEAEMSIKSDIDKLIEQLDGKRLDITRNYDDWLKIGFAIESEFGQAGRSYFHDISKYNPDYSPENCNNQYDKCLKNNNSGITLKTLFHIAKQHGVVIRSMNKSINPDVSQDKKTEKPKDEKGKVTANKFLITEKYLSNNFDLRYNVVSNKFEYKKKDDNEWEEMNENNMYVHLQKNNINISLNNLLALLKSDFVQKHHVFREYFENLPVWDGKVDYIAQLSNYLVTYDRERLDNQFKKWIVRAVRTAIDDKYYNKQAFVIVTRKQNVGKSRFLRYLCPPALSGYIVERLGTDKDSQIALTENFLVNLDELSSAEKQDLNALKSMFSRDKVKARLSYDKRSSVHSRRASFIGSTDKWEFLTDENGSVRWLCFEIEDINWNYESEVDMDKVYSQAYTLLMGELIDYEMSRDEIDENDFINKRFQVSTPERDLILRHFKQSDKNEGEFMTATDILEYLTERTKINLTASKMGRELKFLDFERKSERIDNKMSVYGYWVKKLKK